MNELKSLEHPTLKVRRIAYFYRNYDVEIKDLKTVLKFVVMLVRFKIKFKRRLSQYSVLINKLIS